MSGGNVATSLYPACLIKIIILHINSKGAETKYMIKRTIRIDETLAKDISNIAKEKNQSENILIENALKLYRDFHHMGEKATFINDEIIKINQSAMNLLEQRINHKANKLLSELAIQSCILNQVIANSLEVPPLDLQEYRKSAVEFLKANNRILRLDEIIE